RSRACTALAPAASLTQRDGSGDRSRDRAAAQRPGGAGSGCRSPLDPLAPGAAARQRALAQLDHACAAPARARGAAAAQATTLLADPLRSDAAQRAVADRRHALV